MKNFVLIMLCMISAGVFAFEFEDVPDSEIPKFALNYHKIPLGNETVYDFEPTAILAKKLWKDFTYEDYKVAFSDGDNDSIYGITLRKEGIPNINISFRTAKSEAQARLTMASWQTDGTVPLEWMLKGYKVTDGIGEAALISKDSQRFFFTRSGVIVEVRLVGEQSEINKMAKMVDDRIIAGHKLITE